ncbi:Voltage-dependent anion-selective channel protein 2 [Liparis tanakae]|uniref:Voltage-dependent anion-selective channel protein 2 n=1 Tax=Liparis tanakae TaxID=230148 RepID=A0A4Z2HPD7_9TELE|nr:Voltage-dependent anion-selective channel protein 2 [Liparis tanakae]
MAEKGAVCEVQPDEAGKGKPAVNKGHCGTCPHRAPKGQGTMAVPPSYADLGKSAKDIFNKGFGYGVLKLDVKTKSQSGVVSPSVLSADSRPLRRFSPPSAD